MSPKSEKSNLKSLSTDELTKHLSMELIRIEDALEASGVIRTNEMNATAEYTLVNQELKGEIKQLREMRKWMEDTYKIGVSNSTLQISSDFLLEKIMKLSDLEKTLQNKGAIVDKKKDNAQEVKQTNVNIIDEIINKLNESMLHYEAKNNKMYVKKINETIGEIKRANPSQLSGFGIVSLVGPLRDLKGFNSRHSMFERGPNNLTSTISDINNLIHQHENKLNNTQGKEKQKNEEQLESKYRAPHSR